MWQVNGAVALVANGRLREAAALLEDVVAAATSGHESDVLLLANEADAELQSAAGRFDLAAEAARRALVGISEPDRFAQMRAKSWLLLVRALHQLHRDTDVDAELARLAACRR